VRAAPATVGLGRNEKLRGHFHRPEANIRRKKRACQELSSEFWRVWREAQSEFAPDGL
jgi:hypothetical protein